MKPVYPDLVEDLKRLLQDFYLLGQEMGAIFLYYLPEQGKKFRDAWFGMRAMTRCAEEDIGWYDSLLKGLRETLKDWDNLHIDLTVKFNNGFYHRRQWVYWEEMYTLIRRFEILIERFESRYKSDKGGKNG
jgi:hypothetical protein